MLSYEQYSKIRDLKGLKDGKVAELAGIGRSTFSDWKSGRSTPKEAKLMKIAAALGVTYAYMIGMESESDPSTAALERIIRINEENGGSSKMASMLYGDTVLPKNINLSKTDATLLEKFRDADDATRAVIARLLDFSIEEENK